MQELLDIIKCMDVMQESYDKIRSLSHEGFMIFLGNLVDQYSSDHGLTSEETFRMLEALVIVQRQVHEELGLATPVA